MHLGASQVKNKIIRLALLFSVFLLSACANSSVSTPNKPYINRGPAVPMPTPMPLPLNVEPFSPPGPAFYSDQLPPVGLLKVDAPCYFPPNFYAVLSKEKYNLYGQIIDMPDEHFLTTFLKEGKINSYVTIIGTPRLACVIAIGVGSKGV